MERDEGDGEKKIHLTRTQLICFTFHLRYSFGCGFYFSFLCFMRSVPIDLFIPQRPKSQRRAHSEQNRIIHHVSNYLNRMEMTSERREKCVAHMLLDLRSRVDVAKTNGRARALNG